MIYMTQICSVAPYRFLGFKLLKSVSYDMKAYQAWPIAAKQNTTKEQYYYCMIQMNHEDDKIIKL